MSQERINLDVQAYAFLDCCAQVGRYPNPHPGAVFGVAELQEEMRYAGIREAAVHHVHAIYHDSDAGNRQLMREIKGRENLLPVWVLTFRGYRSAAQLERSVNRMLRAGVRICRVGLSGANGGTADALCHWPLWEALQPHRLPLCVDLAPGPLRLAQWQMLDRLLDVFDQLPVVVSAASLQADMESLLARLSRFGNLHVETSGLNGFDSLERVASEAGAERLLFGTRFPHLNAACAVFRVLMATLKEREKKAVAGENLRRLMQGIRL